MNRILFELRRNLVFEMKSPAQKGQKVQSLTVQNPQSITGQSAQLPISQYAQSPSDQNLDSQRNHNKSRFLIFSMIPKAHSFSIIQLIKIILSALAGLSVATLITHSALIALPYALMISGVPLFLERRKQEKRKIELRNVWPEILDHIISGLRSGLSLSETLSELGKRGPELTKEFFKDFEKELKGGVDFNHAITNLKCKFDEPMADQVCEILKFARGSGSRDTSLTLRTLSDFIRSDLDLRSEIAAKHGWIKNSATLAAVAPWILLLILVSQPSTMRSFSSPSGLLILVIGALMTLIAYFWMNLVGRLPENPRVFK